MSFIGFLAKGIWLLIGFTLSQLVNAMVRAHGMYLVKLIGIDAWSIIITAVFHKTLKLSNNGGESVSGLDPRPASVCLRACLVERQAGESDGR